MSKYIGSPVVSLSTDTVDVTGDITTTDATPEVIIVNDTHEDTDGGREGKVTFKGQQSGGEETTLAQIQASHDGTSDDEKGDLIFKTNDGSDGASPTERMRIDSAGQITLTGNIANTSGDFTLDVDGDIVLDANGAQLRFKDDGTEIGVISNSSNDLQIVSSVSDADMIFRGNDGGSPFNALTLDMSDAGTAIFNNKVGIGQNSPATKLDVDGGANSAHATFSGTAGRGLKISTASGGAADEVVDFDAQASGSTQALTFSTGGTERVRINGSNGRVGIGVGDPDAALDVSRGTNSLGILRLTQRLTGAAAYGLDVGLDPTLGDPTFSRIVNDTVTEAFRIVRASGRIHIGDSLGSNAFADLTAAGNILITGIGATFGDNAQIYNVGGFSGDYDLVIFRNANGIVGRININGSTTTYATSSDYRMKENVVPISDGITRLKQLKPSRFNFIADADKKVDGFLAHEAQTVVPEAVTGTKDELEVWKEHEELPDGVSVGDNKLDDNGNTVPKMQGVDQSKLVPLLTAALQEAIAKIETLETKVAALEGE